MTTMLFPLTRFLAIALAAVFVLSLSVMVMAAGYGRGTGVGKGRGANSESPGLGLGICGGSYAFMWDENGSFLDKEAFEARIDKAINDGLIVAEDKIAMLEMYDYCAAYGGGCGNGRSGCGMGFYFNAP